MFKRCSYIASIGPIRTGFPLGKPVWRYELGSTCRHYAKSSVKPKFPYPAPGPRRHPIGRCPNLYLEPSPEKSEPAIEGNRSVAVSNTQESDNGDVPERDASRRSQGAMAAREEHTEDEQTGPPNGGEQFKPPSRMGTSSGRSNIRSKDLWSRALLVARQKSRDRFVEDYMHQIKSREKESDIDLDDTGAIKLMPPLKEANPINFLYQQSILNGNMKGLSRPPLIGNGADDVNLEPELNLETVDSVVALEKLREDRERRRAQKNMLDLMEQQSKKDQEYQDQHDRWGSELEERMRNIEKALPRQQRNAEEKLDQQLLIAHQPRIEVPLVRANPRPITISSDSHPKSRISVPLSPTATAVQSLPADRWHEKLLQVPPRTVLELGEPPEVMRSLRRIRSLARTAREKRFNPHISAWKEDTSSSPPLTEQPKRSRGPVSSVMDVHKARAEELEQRRLKKAGSKQSATSILHCQIVNANRS
ncbi:hypothetical protein KR018_006498 [Drosophila ironensis]|nr:hypothetical protein KR018_006498 [Drosophila ironensis]